MRIIRNILVVGGSLIILLGIIGIVTFSQNKDNKDAEEIKLPPPELKGKVSLEEVLSLRRSIREYQNKELTLEQIGQLLWAANGKNKFRRTVPSAGALYPMEVYAVYKEGVYHYQTNNHSLKLVKKGDVRADLAKAALGQEWVRLAPLSIVITGNYEKCARRYRERAERYVHIEAGHIGQNIYLQAVTLGLGTVAVGAFYDEEVKKVLKLPEKETPLYIFPIGYPAE